MRAVIVLIAAWAVAPLAHAQDHDLAVSTTVQYTADLLSNTSGGRQTGAKYLDKLELQLDATAHLTDAVDFHGFVDVGYTNGASFSRTLVGDAQGVSNIEAFRGLNVFQAWAAADFRRHRASIVVGLVDANGFFDTEDVASLFLNSSHGVGPELSHSGRSGPSIYPLVSLGAVAEKVLGQDVDGQRWILRGGVFDGAPGDPDAPDHFAIRLRGDEGAFVIAQVEKQLGPDARVEVGYWRYTAKQARLSPVGAPDTTGDDGAYARIEGPLPAALRGTLPLTGWVRIGAANSRFNGIDRYLGGGVVWTGPFAAAGDDSLGLSLASAGFGGPYRRSAGGPIAAHETTIELTYRSTAWRALTIQPDLQYVVHPGGDRSLGDALVIGVRFGLRTAIGGA